MRWSGPGAAGSKDVDVMARFRERSELPAGGEKKKLAATGKVRCG